MRFLLKRVNIIDPQSNHHQKVRDILIEKGRISQIKSTISGVKATEIKIKNLHLSPSWIDVGSRLLDPGYENVETIEELLKSALIGGYGHLLVLPNTMPVIDNKSSISYLMARSNLTPTKIHPIASISKGSHGEELSELYDLKQTGAVAFSDGNRPLQHTGLMLRALQYVKAMKIPIINHPFDEQIAYEGQIHEGAYSVQLGLKGIPAIAETSMLKRDIDLLRYTESMLHCLNISCQESIGLVENAKKENLQITASTSIMNLVETVESIGDFNSAYKVEPPLRSMSDKNALKKAALKGTIDLVTSNHQPLLEDQKKLEFGFSTPGALGLQTCFSLMLRAFENSRSLSRIIELIATNPRKIFSLKPCKVAEGEEADFTLFDPDQEWIFNNEALPSKARNSPYLTQKMTGKALGLLNQNGWHPVNKTKKNVRTLKRTTE